MRQYVTYDWLKSKHACPGPVSRFIEDWGINGRPTVLQVVNRCLRLELWGCARWLFLEVGMATLIDTDKIYVKHDGVKQRKLGG